MSDDKELTASSGATTSQITRIELDVLAIFDGVKAIKASIAAINPQPDQANWQELFTKLDALAQTFSGIFDIGETTFQALEKFSVDATARLGKIEQDINGDAPLSNDAVSVRFLQPIYYDLDTGEEVHMAQPLMNDVVSAVLVEFDNIAGQSVPAPAAGAITLAVVDAAGVASVLATAGMSADGTRVQITPASPKGSALGDITVMFDDTTPGSDFKTSADFTLTNDPGAATVRLNTADITTSPMP